MQPKKALRDWPVLRKTAYLASFPLLRRALRFEGLHQGGNCFIFGDGHPLNVMIYRGSLIIRASQ